MNKLIFITIILWCCFVLSIQTLPDSPYYTAGVVEFHPEYLKNGKKNTEVNLVEYLKIINSIEAVNLDILVFPESSISSIGSYIPEPNDHILPCNNNLFDNVIQNISCAAKNTNKYVVINLTEKSNCTKESQMALNDTRPCADNNLNMYNTNVVFDRNGVVISRYRKFNLFGEFDMNTTLKADISIFKTDFNVTFGHFICFDLLFYTPGFDILSKGITDIIYPTMWFSELPFLTAVQYQENWAYTNNVNLLAAGANNPKLGSTGTGIYNGRKGSLVSVMNFAKERKLYVANVTKHNYINTKTNIDEAKPNKLTRKIANDMLNLKLNHLSLKFYKSVELDITKKNSTVHICHNELCCDISIEISLFSLTKDQESYKYRFIAFDGVRSYEGFKTGGETVCGIIACTNNTVESCGLRFNKTTNVGSQVNFNSISITGCFIGGTKIMTLPSSVDTSILPLSPTEFNYSQTLDYEINNQVWRNISYRLHNPKSDLLTFAIYSRNFEKDGLPETGGAQSTFITSKHLWIIISGFILLYFMK